MSKATILSTIMSNLFPKSEKAISEKLTSEEHTEFSADVNVLNAKLEEAESANVMLKADLDTANATIGNLQNDLTASGGNVISLNEQLSEMTAQRDTFKAHYDLTAQKGSAKADEDENSRGTLEMSSYNENAISVFKNTHGIK